jgi:hypothetical protein
LRSRAILTVAAATAATLGGGLAAAATATATTGPLRTPSTPKSPFDESLDLANNWCVPPLRLDPLGDNLLPTRYQACDSGKTGGGNGVHVLNDLCLVPVSLDSALSGAPAPYAACSDKTVRSSGTAILRNASVLGLQATF